MLTLEFDIEDREYVAIGDDPVFMLVYTRLSNGRQLTNMRWPSLTKFVVPDRIGEERELDDEHIRAIYGERLPRPRGVYAPNGRDQPVKVREV